MNSSIQLYSGRLALPLDVKPEDVNIEDIAHSLSNKCRFTGHTKEFYSVAQHSVFVSWLAEQTGVDAVDSLARQGLLHDADESFLPDVATPIKVLPEFAFFREAGQKIFRTVMAEFDLPVVEDPRVKTADRIMLVTEKRDLMSPKSGWEQDYKEQAADFHIVPLSPKRAKRQFMARYLKLFGKGFKHGIC